MTRVTTNAELLFSRKRFVDLDALINRYATLQWRLDDGRFKLEGISEFFQDTFGTLANGESSIQGQLDPWIAANPKSAGAALAAADAWLVSAWRARGKGLADSVTPEGWRLFDTRLRRSLKVLQDSESFAASNPLWYLEYLQVEHALNIPIEQQMAIYERGIKTFPEFFPLHLEMLESYRPQWQGSVEEEVAFIEAVVAHSPLALRSQMYTRLWLRADQRTGLEVNIFRDMGASWPRMKEGFESLLKAYPNSRYNKSVFASFACVAGDAPTYVRLRAALGNRIFQIAFPPNNSIDVCDARAAANET